MIDILVPTRQRLNRQRELLDSIVGKSKDVSGISVYFYFDQDDEATYNQMPKLAKNYPGLKIEHVVGDEEVLSCMWNVLWKASDGEIIMLAADDIQFETEDWDRIVVDKFKEYPDGIAFVYGKDGNMNQRLGTHGFVSRRSTEVLGYFVPPYFKTWYNDTWINRIYEAVCRRVYVPELHIEHYHECKYPQYRDVTAMRVREGVPEATKVWESKHQERIEDSEKLANEIRRFAAENGGG